MARVADQNVAVQVVNSPALTDAEKQCYWWLFNYGPQDSKMVAQYFPAELLSSLVNLGLVSSAGESFDVTNAPAPEARQQPAAAPAAASPPADSGKAIPRPPRPKLKKILPELESLVSHMTSSTAAMPKPYTPSKEMQQLLGWMRQQVVKTSKPRKK